MVTTDNLLFDGVSPLTLQIIVAAYTVLFCSGLIVDFRLLFERAWRGVDWKKRITHMRTRPWTLWDASFLVALLFCIQYLVSVVFHWVSVRYNIANLSTAPTAIITQSLLFHGLGLLIVLLLMRQRRLSWMQAWGMTPRSAGKNISAGLIAYLAIIPALAVIALLNDALLGSLHIDITPQDVALLLRDMKSPWLLTYLCFFTLIVAPVFEEMLFRGIVFPVMTRHFGLWPALLLSSLAFGSIHFHLPSLIPLAAIAGGFALAYLLTESLMVAIVMHSVFNGINLLLLLLLRH